MISSDDIAQGSSPDFLRGGGEMGDLMRSHDWTSTPLGPQQEWPGALKTAVRLILNTGHPMYLWWGQELLCFYNDAYRRTLGPERHPGSLGRPGREVWSEIWPLIGSQVEFVMSGHGSTWDENRLVPITRNGQLDEIYWTYSYCPVDDEGAPSGVGGVLVICSETTEAVLAERRHAAQTKRQRRLFEQAPGFIAILSGADHVFEFANAAYRRLVGGRDPTGRAVREALPEVEGQGFFELLDRVYATGERFVAKRSRISLERLVGLPEDRFLDFIYEPVVDEDGRVTGIFVEGYDVTDTHVADNARAESEARLLALARASSDVLYRMSPDWGEMRSLDGGGFLADTNDPKRAWLMDYIPDVERARVVEAIERAISDKAPFELEHRVMRADGTVGWTLSRAVPVFSPGGDITEWFGAASDITARREAEEQLRALNADLERQVTERTLSRGRTWQLSPEIMGVLNADGYFEQANPAWEPVLGWSAEELSRTVFFDLIHPDDLAKTQMAWEAAIERGEAALRFENRYRTKGGDWRWLSWVAVPEDKKVYCSARDITAEKDREAALAERTVERDRMWRLSTDLMLVAGFDGTINSINPAWTNMLGWKDGELMGTNFLTLVHPEDHDATVSEMAKLDQGVTTFRFQNRYRGSDGRYHWVSWTAVPAAELIHAVGRDITAEKEAAAELEAAQEALRQSQKMEAMGQLTGGVAHDFNNLLTPIIGGLDMLQRKGVGTEREQRLIGGAMQSAERAKTLVQRLLAFARRQPLQTSAVGVGELVKGMADLVGSTSGPQIKVVVEAAEDLPPALADFNQLEMALLNLGVNARDAMPNGGTLRITADHDHVGHGHRSKLRPGNYIRLSVADTGTGMDDATVKRAVEPFFSTKGVGKGTGLGLSMVHGLASQLGGALTIKSSPGLGTNIELWLPVSERQLEVPKPQSIRAPTEAARGTALLVDDEELVRASTADMLADMGFAVIEAASAEEALRLLEAGLDADLLISDHLMPGMNGTDLARAVRSQHPGMRVLIVSGYAEGEGIDGDLPRLTKPFRSADLVAKLSELAAEG